VLVASPLLAIQAQLPPGDDWIALRVQPKGLAFWARGIGLSGAISGNPMATLSVGELVGPADVLEPYLERWGKVVNAKSNRFIIVATPLLKIDCCILTQCSWSKPHGSDTVLAHDLSFQVADFHHG
jgi:hypothetical protein